MILETTGLSRRFGGLKAVDGVTFSAAENAVHSIIGPNGAGKTTFFNLVTGALPADSGSIVLRGEDVTGKGPDALVRRGLVRTFQRTSIFKEASALENVSLAVLAREGRSRSVYLSGGDARRVRDEARSILADVGLSGRDDVKAAHLAHGSQRSLDIAIGLAGRPRIILMDEPLAGMSRGDRSRVGDLIAKLRDELKLAVVLVEHDVGMVMQLSDRITVMQHGRVIAVGAPTEIRDDPAVKKAYLSGSFAA